MTTTGERPDLGTNPFEQRRQQQRRRRRRKPLVVLGGLLGAGICVVGAIAVYALAWPAVHLQSDSVALARVDVAPVGVRLERVAVANGATAVPVALTSRRIVPQRLVEAGTKLTVVATVRRSGWLSWIAGRTEKVTLTAVAPAARVATQSLHPKSGRPVAVRFTTPVTRVQITVGGHRTTLAGSSARRVVETDVRAAGANRAGTLTVAAAPRSWEALGPPERVSWFPPASSVQALVQPVRGTPLAPDRQIRLTLSEAVSKAFGSQRPTLTPAVPGHWVDVDDYTLSFVPTGAGYALGSHVRIALPTAVSVLQGATTHTLQSISWQVPEGTTLRLQQLLAELGYLPLKWQPATTEVATTFAAQTKAAIAPPAGTFSWRWANVPQQLRSFWSEGNWTTLTYGAVMRFEHDHGLAVDGLVGPSVWRALLKAAVAQQQAVGGYGYVLVTRSVPQTLTLYNNGKVILQARVNTGVAGAPTALGTWPVFERASTTTMSGVNPDGSHYHDEGIKWVSYFHGGEAIHGFNRASYGFPQSVGCVEAPVTTAGRIWPYTPIGTLVTITA